MKFKITLIMQTLLLLSFKTGAAVQFNCQRYYTDQELEQYDLDDIDAYNKQCSVDLEMENEKALIKNLESVSWSEVLQGAHHSRMKKIMQLADRVRLAFPLLTSAIVDFAKIEKEINEIKNDFTNRSNATDLTYEFNRETMALYDDLSSLIGKMQNPIASLSFNSFLSFFRDFNKESNEQYQLSLDKIQNVIAELESYYKQLQNRVENAKSIYISRLIMDKSFSNFDNLANMIFNNMFLNTKISDLLNQSYRHTSFGIVNQGDIEYQMANFYISQMFIGISDEVGQKIKENMSYQNLLQTMDSIRNVRQQTVKEGVTSVVRSTIAMTMQNINTLSCLKRSREAVRQYNKAIADLNEINKKGKLMTPRLAQISYENIALRFENVEKFCRGVQ